MPDDALEQIKVALDNIRLNLEAAGMTAQHIVKLTVYLVDQVDTGERRRILAEFSEGTAP